MNIKLKQLCSIQTGKLDVNAHVEGGDYPFFTCAKEVYEIDNYAFDGDSILLAGNGDFHTHYFSGKFNAYQRTYVFQNFRVNPKFVYHGLNWNITRLRVSSRGSTIKYLRIGDIEDLNYPLLPIKTQQRIVSEIEKQFARIDAGIESLNIVERKLKEYKASVLKSAVEGKLTADRRKKNPDVQPASELLEEILVARRKKREEEKIEEFKSKGKRPQKNDGWKEKYKEPDAVVNAENSSVLPKTWVYTSFDQATNVYVGSTPSRGNESYRGGEVNRVSSGEVAFNDIYDTKETITSEGYNSCSTKLHPPGTIMMGMIGEGKTRGQVARLKIEACHNQNTAAIEVGKIDTDYMYYYLMGNYNNLRSAGGGGNQKALSKTRINLMSFPLPPSSEQIEIVRIIDSKISITDNLLANIDNQYIKMNNLKKSILQKAFSGELVPQLPEDGDVEELLEQIKIAKTEYEAEMKEKKKRKKS